MGEISHSTFLFQSLIQDAKQANILFRKTMRLVIRKPRKYKKNSQYSKPYKRNYPYWKGYPYSKEEFNICKPDIDKKRIEFLFDPKQ